MSGPTVFSVAWGSDLDAAIEAIDQGGSASAPNTTYVIDVTTDLSLTSLPSAWHRRYAHIEGTNPDNPDYSATIDGGGSRGFVVNSGSVVFSDLSLIAMAVPGDSGGGPAGVGAAYVGSGGSVVANSVSFSGDSAHGGTAAGGAVFVAKGRSFSASGGSLAGSGSAAASAMDTRSRSAAC